MAKMNFDFKQFLLQKGERVGLYVAAGLAVLLIALGVILLAGRDGSLSAGANAAAMQKDTEDKEKLKQVVVCFGSSDGLEKYEIPEEAKQTVVIFENRLVKATRRRRPCRRRADRRRRAACSGRPGPAVRRPPACTVTGSRRLAPDRRA